MSSLSQKSHDLELNRKHDKKQIFSVFNRLTTGKYWDLFSQQLMANDKKMIYVLSGLQLSICLSFRHSCRWT